MSNSETASTTLKTSIGVLHLTASPQGLYNLDFESRAPRETAGSNDSANQATNAAAREHLEHAVRELNAYFSGDLQNFTVRLDLSSVGGPFSRKVLAKMQQIKYGTTKSYQELAASAGSPGASRGAGSACARNPVPLIVPCHRVVRADGTMGEYAGGRDIKQTLLDFERETIASL